MRHARKLSRCYPSDADVVGKGEGCADLFIARKCHASEAILRNQYQPGRGALSGSRLAVTADMQAFIGVDLESHIGAGKSRLKLLSQDQPGQPISVGVNLDAVAPVRINTGISFYDHMDQIAKHGGFFFQSECDGDLS